MTTLVLSYNSFIGTVPAELEGLQNLELLHLHSNRLFGTIPLGLNVNIQNPSSFITDCGVPSAFEEPLVCGNCSMCCESWIFCEGFLFLSYLHLIYHTAIISLGNLQGECQPNEETKIQQDGFESYESFTWVFFLSVFGFCCVLFLASRIFHTIRNKNRSIQARRQSQINRDTFVALDSIGIDSVYQFFLGNRFQGSGQLP